MSSSVPSISRCDVPAPPHVCAHLVEHGRQIGHLGLARRISMTVVPLASTAAIMRLSVAVWLGYSSTMRLPTKPGAGRARCRHPST